MDTTFFDAVSINRGLIEKVKRKIRVEVQKEPASMEDIIRVSVETARSHDDTYRRCINAQKIASLILEPGDTIRAMRDGGRRQSFTFAGWDGYWAVSRSGVSDISASNIDKVNGVPVHFSELWNQRTEVLYETFKNIKERRPIF